MRVAATSAISGKDQLNASHDDISMRSATDDSLAPGGPHFHARQMFIVSEEEAAAIRDAFDRGVEFAAGVELRRRFPAWLPGYRTVSRAESDASLGVPLDGGPSQI